MSSSATSSEPAMSWRAIGWRDWVGLAARLVLGGVLFVAGALKVTNLPASALAVRAYKILQYDLAGIVGYMLPVAELAVGALLIVGVFTRWTAAIGGLFMMAFVIGIASAWARGLSLDCGCFGGGGEVELARAMAAYPWEIARDVGLLALAAWLVARPAAPYSLETRLFGPATIDDTDLDEE